MTADDHNDLMRLRKVERAQRMLARLNLSLREQKGAYIIVDHTLGVPWGTPFEADIDAILAWTELKPKERDRLAREAKDKLGAGVIT